MNCLGYTRISVGVALAVCASALAIGALFATPRLTAQEGENAGRFVAVPTADVPPDVQLLLQLLRHAVGLADGRILLNGDGGRGGPCPLVVFDPEIDTFAPVQQLHACSISSPAIRLQDGRVLVLGGDIAEFYDPVTNTVLPAGRPIASRIDSTATLLADGRVLVAGGRMRPNASLEVSASSELFDPATGTFTAGPAMTTPRIGDTATALQDGTVLLAGGRDESHFFAAADLYSPRDNTTVRVENMQTARAFASATALPDGRVLILGGATGGPSIRSAELYDPLTQSFRLLAATTSEERIGASATRLQDGTVLIAGGAFIHCADDGCSATDSSELYDPVAERFRPGPAMVNTRTDHTAIALADGSVLMAGVPFPGTNRPRGEIVPLERYLPAAAAPGLPATGTGGLADEAPVGGTIPPAVIAAAVAAGLSLGATLLLRRRCLRRR